MSHGSKGRCTRSSPVLYATVEGWDSSFLRVGARAIIGSLWEVVDTSASIYAQEFYRAALAGDTIGECFRSLKMNMAATFTVSM